MAETIEQIEQKMKELRKKKREAQTREKIKRLGELEEENKTLKEQMEKDAVSLGNYNLILEQLYVLNWDVKYLLTVLEGEASKKRVLQNN